MIHDCILIIREDHKQGKEESVSFAQEKAGQSKKGLD
jgi:hypothetical protein